MPQRRIHCPLNSAAASLFSGHRCSSQLASMPVPDVLALPQLAGQNTEVENIIEEYREHGEHGAFVGLTGDGRELGTGAVVSELKECTAVVW